MNRPTFRAERYRQQTESRTSLICGLVVIGVIIYLFLKLGEIFS